MLEDMNINYSPADLVRSQEQDQLAGFVPASESYDWKERPSTFPSCNLILNVLYTCPGHCDTL